MKASFSPFICRITTLIQPWPLPDSNWHWAPQNQALWTQTTDTLYQSFNSKWRNHELEVPTALYDPDTHNLHLPYKLNIGGATTKDAEILVTAAFVRMLRRILLLRSDVLNLRHDNQGVVIIGQPGIGALHLQARMLASKSAPQFNPLTH